MSTRGNKNGKSPNKSTSNILYKQQFLGDIITHFGIPFHRSIVVYILNPIFFSHYLKSTWHRIKFIMQFKQNNVRNSRLIISFFQFGWFRLNPKIKMFTKIPFCIEIGNILRIGFQLESQLIFTIECFRF